MTAHLKKSHVTLTNSLSPAASSLGPDVKRQVQAQFCSLYLTVLGLTARSVPGKSLASLFTFKCSVQLQRTALCVETTNSTHARSKSLNDAQRLLSGRGGFRAYASNSRAYLCRHSRPVQASLLTCETDFFVGSHLQIVKPN